MQSLSLSLLSDEFLSQARERENNRVYNTPVVLLLMILQRLQAWNRPCWNCCALAGSMRAAAARRADYVNQHGRLQQSASEVAVEFRDKAFAQMTACTNGSLPAIGRRAFVFDGTTVRTPHTKALRQLYPPTSNQEGESHWRLIRMLVAHDVTTGLGMRPEWGAMNGPHAVSEQRLFEQAVVVADANFGVFSVAFASTRQNHPVVVRMTATRAKSMWKGPLRDGIDKRIDWKPTKLEANQAGSKPRRTAKRTPHCRLRLASAAG